MVDTKPSHVCQSCWDGNHGNHRPGLGGICIGCSCDGKQVHEVELPDGWREELRDEVARDLAALPDWAKPNRTRPSYVVYPPGGAHSWTPDDPCPCGSPETCPATPASQVFPPATSGVTE